MYFLPFLYLFMAVTFPTLSKFKYFLYFLDNLNLGALYCALLFLLNFIYVDFPALSVLLTFAVFFAPFSLVFVTTIFSLSFLPPA
jgi:hypothetical protein